MQSPTHIALSFEWAKATVELIEETEKRGEMVDEQERRRHWKMIMKN